MRSANARDDTACATCFVAGELKAKLPGIQILRAVAALMVVVWHVGGIAKNFEDIDATPPPFLMFGYAGVDLFFVLSGYIICRVCSSREFHWKDFVRKRFLRIYPFYALFSGLALLAWMVNPAFVLGGMEPTLSSIVDSFFVLPQQARSGPFRRLVVGTRGPVLHNRRASIRLAARSSFAICSLRDFFRRNPRACDVWN
jgi:Acyltransferase family